MTRRLLTSALAFVALCGIAVPGYASELDDLLRAGREADYRSSQLVACDTPAGTRNAELNVSQVGGILTVHSVLEDGIRAQVAPGGVAFEQPDGVVEATVLDPEAGPDRPAPASYEVMLEAIDDYLGRPARRVSVYRDGSIRSRMVVDLDTGALLESETLNGDGSTYCHTEAIEFTPVQPVESGAFIPVDLTTARRLQSADPNRVLLPEEVAGFRLADAYEWDDEGGTMAYYDDGFFSFAVVHSRRPFAVDGLDSEQYEHSGGTYARSFGPGWSLYVWETERGGLALYGDLPLDLQEAVIEGLPAPNRPGFFTRLWRRLFG